MSEGGCADPTWAVPYHPPRAPASEGSTRDSIVHVSMRSAPATIQGSKDKLPIASIGDARVCINARVDARTASPTSSSDPRS
jgi:hypothetical protein